MPWHSWINAEIYDRFVRERGIYAWLNRHLVRLADVGHARRILDLGCGTGATTAACLGEMGSDAEIVGIDSSVEMVGVARANVFDPRAHFEVAAAASVDRLEGEFDRVVCNAAFWQFPAAGPVFRGLSRRTLAGARFVFNVPAERVVGHSAPIHPFQVMLVQEIVAATGHRLESAPATLHPAQLEASAAQHGFDLVGCESCVYEGRQDELIELMSIPAMLRPLAPGLDTDTTDAVWRRARDKADPDLQVSVPWVYFALERRRDPQPGSIRGTGGSA